MWAIVGASAFLGLLIVLLGVMVYLILQAE